MSEVPLWGGAEAGTAAERRGNNLKLFDGFYLKATARIWR